MPSTATDHQGSVWASHLSGRGRPGGDSSQSGALVVLFMKIGVCSKFHENRVFLKTIWHNHDIGVFLT